MLALLLLLVSSAGPGPLSLRAAQALADQHSGALSAAQAQVAVSRAGVEAAGQLANPTVSASIGQNDPKLTAGIDVKLPLFGQRGAALDSAVAASRVTESEAQLQRSRLHAAIRRAHAALWAAGQQASLASDAAALASKLAALTGERFRLGGVAELEVEQAKQAQRRAGQDLADRQAEASAAREELAALLGIDPPGLDAAAPEPVELPPVEALAQKAAAHPELEGLRRQQLAATARADEERTAIRPLPSVSLTAERLGQDAGIGLRAGLAFDVPLLSWNRGRVHQQEQLARVAAEQQRAAEQRLGGQLRAARARWSAAVARAGSYARDLVAGASRVLEMAQAGYRIGRTTLITVLQAQAELASARSRAIDATLDSQRAIADLEEAVGADL